MPRVGCRFGLRNEHNRANSGPITPTGERIRGRAHARKRAGAVRRWCRYERLRAPVISIFTRRTDSTTFHLRWRGYDRAEVDEFLRQTAADRQRLQEGLAQLEC